MTWFWWFYAMVITTWTVAVYRYNRAMGQADTGGGRASASSPGADEARHAHVGGAGNESDVVLGRHFAGMGAHDRMTAGIIVGIMLC